MRSLILFVLLLSFASCAPTHLTTVDHYENQPGFSIDEEATIEDNLNNREVIDVIIQYRNALVRKDFGTLKRIISADYFDNSGTTNTTTDDYDSNEIPKVFEAVAQHAENIKYKVILKAVEVKENQAFIDYEFEYAYAYKVGGELLWDAGVDVNRLELKSEDGNWKIISGL